MAALGPSSETLKSRARRLWHLWVVLGIVVILIGGYVAGFRPGPGLTLTRVGTLTITDIPKGTAVFVDQSSRGASSGASLSMSLVPGNHTVIVSAPNAEPWEKIIKVTSGTALAVSPIIVPVKPVPVLLTGDEQTAAAAAIAQATLPTVLTPLLIGCAEVYVSENRVLAAPATTTPGCETPPDYLCTAGSCAPTLIYAPTTLMRAVIPFPKRTDAIVVSTGASVNAVGLDPGYPQYFAPIARGTTPNIGVASSTGLYISDSGKTFFMGL